MAVDDGVRREVVHAGESHLLHLAEPVPHPAPRVGRMHAANDRDFLDDREHLVFSDLHRDRIGVTIRHHAGRRTVAHHAESARVIDDDQISAAFLDELCADARAGAGGDDRLAAVERRAQSFANFFARVRISFSGPRVGHVKRERNV